MSKGLLTLQTDLKSLRYGNDKPYVTKDINNPPSSNKTGMQGTKRVDDLSRIAQMLVDRPGLKHLGNEALLKQVGVQDRIEKSRKSGKSVAGALLKELGGTALTTVKVIGSTIAQVPVNGTGTHFLRGFRTDTYLQPSGGNTRSAFAQFFGAGGVEGAPYAIRGEIVPGVVNRDKQNFGSSNGPTGRFNPTPSLYDYNAKVNVDNNEGQNTPIPEWASKKFYNSTLASQGKVIPVSKTEIKPVQGVNADTGEVTSLPGFNVPFQQAPKAETTLSPGSLGISNKDIEGDITQLDQPTVGLFKEEDQVVKTKGITKENIRNALAGQIIPFFEAGKDTTAVKGDETSLVRGISNHFLDVKPDLSDNGNVGSPKYSSGSTYTGHTSDYTIARALDGKRIVAKSIPGSIERPRPTAEGVQPTYQPYSDPMLITDLQQSDISQGPTTKVKDFRKLNTGNLSNYSFDYSSDVVNKETRINLGNQGRKGKAKTSYMITDDLDIDKVNAADRSSERLDGTAEGRDLAKFYFEIITPDSNTFLHFRAFIDSIDDGYTADWKAHKYVGRAENFYTYGGFDRDINVSFKIAAATRKEMKPLYRKMVYLASSTAPTYGTSGLMRGTLARLTIGSYFSQIPGVITSVKFTLDNEAPWEISLANPDGGGGNSVDDDVQELPMVLNCSVSFKPIHDFAPQTGLHHYFTNPKPEGGAKSFF